MNSNNKRIAKNTLFLYFRMILVLAVNLLTYRWLLKILGVEDYGLYSVVGGIVLLFTLLNSALSSGSSRFITFALGEDDKVKLRKTFSMSFSVHLVMAFVIFLLLETIGLWYVNTYLVVLEDRMVAANWLFQFSVISCLLSLTQVPYSALIIAHERMNIYAYVGVAEAIFKLVLVGFLFLVDGYDKLILFGLMTCLWSIALQLFYRSFCNRNYPESRLMLVKDRVEYQKMLSFSCWDVIGSFTVQGNTQMTALLINSFFGLVYNASFGLANQIKGVLTQFSTNFMTAVNPQITKYYAEKKMARVNSLVYNSSRMSFLLYILVAMPVWVEVDFIIGLWLDIVPDKLALFLRLTILACVIRSFASSVITAVHASGNIKYLNIFSGGFSVLATLPLTYFFYYIHFPVETTYYIILVTSVGANIIELLCLKHENISFNIGQYVRSVYFPCVILFIVVLFLLLVLSEFLVPSFLRLIIVAMASSFLICILSYFLILSSEQRKEIRSKFNQYLRN